MPAVPGGVYLCQAGETVSCGACCGLYNRAKDSRESLEELITLNTAEFQKIPRTPDAITEFQVKMERRDPRPRPYPDFYHCPFLGFVGARHSRVGCLLHPQADGNQGMDYRGLSFYGAMACRDYFCPTYRNLPAAYKEIVKAVCTDWYIYGLVITEERMLAGFFSEVERRLNRSLTAADIQSSPDARTAVADFLELKLSWPFRRADWNGVGNYFFNDNRYRPPAVDYARIGAECSPYDVILQELFSVFSSPDELKSAESMIEAPIERIVELIYVRREK
ncbi:MAG: hypothetical protein ACM3KE_05110 [Hyphomicrobiales bacterium]